MPNEGGAPTTTAACRPPHYTAQLVTCTCGCNTTGWLICDDHDQPVCPTAVNHVAAAVAVDMLNAGRLTPVELADLWAADEDAIATGMLAADGDGTTTGVWH